MKNDEIEAALLERVRSLRWTDGLRCPRCGGPECAVHARGGAAGRRKLLCYGCGRTFNDLTGTPFARSHLPLSCWFAGAALMRDGEPTCSELARRLKVKLATAWRIRRVLARVLADPVLRRILTEDPTP